MTDVPVVALTKHHGLGNDFLIALEPVGEVGSAQAKQWCDRRTGIGADGLIVASRSTDETGSSVARDHEWTMVLWNADGSRAEISGNGIRCLGQAIGMFLVAETGGLTPASGTRLLVHTDAGPRRLTLFPSEHDTWEIRAEMGVVGPGPGPSTAWADAGLEPSDQRGVDVGNPHIVAIVDAGQFDAVMMDTAGPIVEAGYGGGINVHVVHIVDEANIEMKIWERGVGVTQACGSGACAAAWAANKLGVVGRKITVTMPGGSATVELADGIGGADNTTVDGSTDGESDIVHLVGPATYVGSVRIA